MNNKHYIVAVSQEETQQWEDYFFCALMQFRYQRLMLPVESQQNQELVQQALDFAGIPHEIFSSLDCKQTLLPNLTEDEKSFLLNISTHGNESEFFLALYDSFYPNRRTSLKHALSIKSDKSRIPMVVSLGKDNLKQASLFALLSDRCLVALDESHSELEIFFSQTIIAQSYFVAFPKTLSTSMLMNFFTLKDMVRNKVPVGFFYPFGNLESLFSCQKALIFNKMSRQEAWPFNFIYPLEKRNSTLTYQNICCFLGRGCNDRDIHNALVNPAMFLFSTPHSNGVDMSLGPVILCSKKNCSVSSHLPVKKAHPCFYDARFCNRLVAGTTLLSPAAVKSMILFFYTCWGVMLENGTYDVEVSLSHQLSKSPFTSHFLTTYTMAYLDRMTGFSFLEKFLSRTAIGTILRDLNADHYSLYRDFNHVIIMFGDPEFRYPSVNISLKLDDLPEEMSSVFLDTHVSLQKILSNIKEQTFLHSNFFSSLDFTRSVVNGMRNTTKKTLIDSVNTLSASTESLWSMGVQYRNRLEISLQTSQNDEPLMNHFQKLLLKFQKSWVEFYLNMVIHLGGFLRLQIDKFFISEQSAHDHSIYKICPYCHERSLESHICMQSYPHVRRRLVECFNCATIFDGIDSFLDGFIICDPEWALEGPQRLSVSLRYNDELLLNNISAIAILEPILKGDREKVCYVLSEQHCKQNNGVISVLFPAFQNLNKYYSRGIHHLNVLVLIREQVLSLRRNILVI